MASWRSNREAAEERQVAINKWLAFAVALLFWAAVFYLFDRLIMAAQGLPVGANLMPA